MDARERIDDDQLTSGLYAHLIDLVQKLGPATVTCGKHSVSVRHGRRSFLVIFPRQASLRLRIATDIRLLSPRIVRQVQTAPHRWHSEVTVETGGELDGELLGWIEHAYAVTTALSR